MHTALRGDRRAGFSIAMAVGGAVVILVAMVFGLAVAYVVTRAPSETPGDAVPSEAGAEAGAEAAPDCEYVPFGTAVANLSGGRLTRYLQVSITCEVDKDSAQALRELFEGSQKAVFKNWLITYLSDKRLDEVDGAVAIKQLQREIQDGFNALLAQSGDYEVNAVLFEEFNIQ